MLFELASVTKTYGSVTALRSLDVQAPTGAIGLLGPNGAGKTTMIRTLLGLITIDEGEGKVLGMDIGEQQLDLRQNVGFVPEDECLFPGVDGIEFIAYAGELCGMSKIDAMQRAHEVLDYVGLGEARYRAIESYSTGMKQRIKLASAIVHDPQLVILDEPTNGMDPKGRVEILELANDLSKEKGMSLLFSSHLLPDVEAVCEHVIVLDRGRLIAQGRIQDLKATHVQSYEVRIKEKPDAFVRRLEERKCGITRQMETLVVAVPDSENERVLWETASELGVQIRHLRPRRSTLEEVFFRAVTGEGSAEPMTEPPLSSAGATEIVAGEGGPDANL